MANRVITGDEAREAVMRGVTTLAAAVKSTLGPRGRNVLLVRPFGTPPPTRDGVTVAKEIELEDPLEMAGARLLRQVAAAADDAAGDGTTTAVVLAEALLHDGMRLVAAGTDRLELDAGLQLAAAWALEAIRDEVIPATPDLIRHAATVSLHGDAGLGAVIAQAIEKVGHEGMILFDDSPSPETGIDHREGFQFDQGWIHPAFVNDAPRMECVLEHPYILLSERELIQADPRTMNHPMNLLPILEKVGGTGRPLLIVAEKVSGDALTILAHNLQRGTLVCCAVEPPGFGPRRKEHLRDLATAVGGTVYSTDVGNSLAKFTLENLGECSRAVILENRTMLVELGGNGEAIADRAEQLKALRAASDDDYEKEELTTRIGRLTDGAVLLSIGARTQTELREKKDRVQDAVNTARSAASEGVVPGGGVTLMKAARAIKMRIENSAMRENERLGARLLLKALEAPLRQIVVNAGGRPDVVVEEISANLGSPAGEAWGYNAAEGDYCDLVDAGIVDSLRVVRTSLEKAVSIAGLLLTTEAVVYPVPAAATDKQPAPQGR